VRILGPLDRIDVDALLGKLPQRAHLTQPLNVLRQKNGASVSRKHTACLKAKSICTHLSAQINRVIHLFLRRETADAKPNRCVGEILQHIRSNLGIEQDSPELHRILLTSCTPIARST
jgi:hypothetical protein